MYHLYSITFIVHGVNWNDTRKISMAPVQGFTLNIAILLKECIYSLAMHSFKQDYYISLALTLTRVYCKRSSV